MYKKGWKVTPIKNLPDGFEIREDSGFMYLYVGDDLVSTFTHFATIEEIMKTCNEQIQMKEAN